MKKIPLIRRFSNKDGDAKKKKSRRPGNSNFKQQRLRACQPILTPIPVITTFLIIGIIFVPLGALLLVSSNQVIEVEKRYDDKCTIGEVCTVSIDIDEKMKEPVYFYYKMTNYYQNHRRYVKSRSDAQLRGEKITSYSDLEDCDPEISQGDSKSKSKLFLPCGLIVKSFFNDSFVLRNENGDYVEMTKEGIAWDSDVEKKFSNPPASAPGIRLIPDFQDEDFVVWMRVAGLPTFKKLYRIIDQDLSKGKYNVEITNLYPVSEFDGEKYIVISTISWIGGKNPFLGYAYIVVGSLCFILGILFALRHIIKPRKLGDVKYLNWNK